MSQAGPQVEVSREMQRFVLAVILVAGFFAVFGVVFWLSRDLEVAKTVLQMIAGAMSTAVGFYFGARSAEEAARG